MPKAVAGGGGCNRRCRRELPTAGDDTLTASKGGAV